MVSNERAAALSGLARNERSFMPNAVATAGADTGPDKSKKKLIVTGIVLAVLLLGGGGTAWILKKDGGEAGPPPAGAKAAPRKTAGARPANAAPVFAPLEPFTVNLADTDSERFAQVTVTLQLDDPTTVETVKTYMPVIRNNILMVLASKKSTDILDAEGKTLLAEQIQRATSRALGYDVDEPDDEDADDARKGKKKRRRAVPYLPVLAVHFANFIVQ
jgi:flagellar FliL protein